MNSMKENSSYPGECPKSWLDFLDAGVGVVLHAQHYKPEDEDTYCTATLGSTQPIHSGTCPGRIFIPIYLLR